MRSARLSITLLSGTVLSSAVSEGFARELGVLAQPASVLAIQSADQAATVVPASPESPRSATPPPTVGERRAPQEADANEATQRVLFEADEVVRFDENSPIIAQGNVRAYFGQRYLSADRLEYNPETDIVVAEGNVAITDENLETAFAGRVELTGDLRDGIAENFSALLKENARIAADTAIREQGARTRMSKAVYTSCNVCKQNGEGKTPTWRIKALRVTRDEERKVVKFRHAFFELKGVPIFYFPFVQGPDPSVERQSGFLTPLVGASSRLGFNFELPYYFAFSNHTDATFFPKYTSNDGVLWQGEFRHRGDSSYNVLSGGIIDFDNTQPDDDGNIPEGIPGVRWNVFGRGHRNFGNNWRLGYDIERVSDASFLNLYDVRRRGDLRQELDTSNTRILRSNAYASWTKGGSRLLIDSYLFQDIRTNRNLFPGIELEDVSSLTPYVLPRIDFRHDINQRVGDGKLSFRANFASLQRTSGTDTRRLTAGAQWRREHFTPGGHRFQATADLRGDAYFFQDLDEGTEICSIASAACATSFPGLNSGDSTSIETRFAPSAALEWSYPLVKRMSVGQIFIEPRVQLVASPAGRNPADILNEDSQSIEYDYVGLFDFNKATGFDRFEDGQRANVGVSASLKLNNGITVEASAGEQFRLQPTDAFAATSGLGEERSDIVGALNLRFRNRFGIENRFRIDDDTGEIVRAESLAFLSFWRFRSNVSYIRLNDDETGIADRREELTGRATFRLTRHWSAGLGWRENLNADPGTESTIRQDLILSYRDECATLDITYRRDETQNEGFEPDNRFLIRFTLRSLVD